MVIDMRKHVIVEGPDGAGKSSLIKIITRDISTLPMHPRDRASDSISGPVASLDHWVVDDLVNMSSRRPSVYDRHPLISEPIYGPITRGKVPGLFNKRRWVDLGLGYLAAYTVIVICLPPLATVRRNVATSAQMAGVVEHINEIWGEYVELDHEFRTTPGMRIVRWDYTAMDEADIIRQINDKREA